ncbi:E1-E2 ATPase-domain-containing protein [Schizophyllum amplum]|uniref:E1-E2 ATPase-domain-containing protein n=1 Tax=Schizophyllum amplum TaxID=97359 RepID=A0A550CS81_9AGAR|nr:E1-E2 ATPase-domain-containing protein [Auriculariopsis ampla]
MQRGSSPAAAAMNHDTASRPTIYHQAGTGRPSAYRYSTNMISNPLGDATTTVHIANLHCSSCVDAIHECLSRLDPPPLSVEVSVVLQTVRVYHHQALAPATVAGAIEDAGFDVLDADPGPSRLSDAERQRRHLLECAQCKQEAEGIATSERSMSKASLEKEPSDSPKGPFKVTLSVGGMTCASCSNAVTGAISAVHGVDTVVVSLLEGSASVVVDAKDRAAEVQEAVDDCGFEATVVTVEPLKAETEPKDTWRTVSLRVDGMYCRHCPGKINSALRSLPEVFVDKHIDSLDDPVLTLRYRPLTPSLTIRSIISTISSANDPPFTVSIYKPPSVEQLSRRMQLSEKRALLLRLIVAVIIAIPTFILGIVYMSLVPSSSQTKMYLMEPMWAGNTSRVTWALFFLSTPVMFYSANLFHRRSFKELRALWRPGNPTPIWKRFVRFGSMNLLVSMGVSVAYFASIALLALSSVQERNEDGMGDRTTYFDSVIFLTMFLLAGRYLESYSKARTADAVNALASLRPTKALLLVARDSKDASGSSFATNSSDLEKGDPESEARVASAPPGYDVEHIPVDLLEIGDTVRVPSGSTPPADGVIVDGTTRFDESSLTGESRLIPKVPGDKVWLGTINRGSVTSVRVDEVGGETMLDNIVKVVREGQTRRAPIERVADLITGYFVPVVTLLAVVTWLVWLILGFSGALPDSYLDIEVGGWTVWSLEFAIAVFVVACPCGIGLAAPTALLVSSGLAAKFGILARGGGEAFEEMSRLDVLVFDKTGTLTEGGSPSVSDAHFIPGPWRKEVVLGVAAELESTSGHPLGIAIREYAQRHGGEVQHGVAFQEAAGRGLKAQFDALGEAVIGNEAWMAEHGVRMADAAAVVEKWKGEAKSVVLLAIRQDMPESAFELVAAFAVTDPLRAEAMSVVEWLQKEGIETWMISGDNAKTAAAVAVQVGIPSQNVIADVLPTEKADKIEWLQRSGPRARSSKSGRAVVGMVGDGINDAPALTAADVGIAVASGSDVAISSASFILLTSDLRSLVTLRDLARTTIRRVKFNFVWALVYNLAAVPIAAGVIYPAGHARLDPVWASLAMALSSVSVVCSSLMLKLYSEPRMSSV